MEGCPNIAIEHPQEYETTEVAWLGAQRTRWVCHYCGQRWEGRFTTDEARRHANDQARRLLEE